MFVFGVERQVFSRRAIHPPIHPFPYVGGMVLCVAPKGTDVLSIGQTHRRHMCEIVAPAAVQSSFEGVVLRAFRRSKERLRTLSWDRMALAANFVLYISKQRMENERSKLKKNYRLPPSPPLLFPLRNALSLYEPLMKLS